MDTYHKINALFKRYQSGPKKGKLILGDWAQPEFEYLAGNRWEFTEKVDGTNIRINFSRVADSIFMEFGGRTDNADLPKPLLAWLKETFPNSPSGSGANATVGRWMVDEDITNVTLYGEGYGPKIQNGGNYSDEQKFVLFDVKVGNWWLHREAVNEIGARLGLDTVPVIGYGTIQDAIDIVSTGYLFNDQGAIVRYGSGGLQSQWGNFEAEGIVARPVVPLFTRRGDRIITKIKAVDF